ncbi:LysR family transcriptional regulator [Sinimarinibacterium sp. CAU 1509]|uniref:LysR family transcriptional regulator n=1 Tax=Sinimarinibacterium sp. CAU 1509 TaxID=2562283 RepID=UPI0010AB6EF0|nr:LysR family transcriptional regulator [Sinimarinibacterium sp. CAU 1509]TJY63301.1 LysR family transcriptional regulator [Sinimarinibacterium sp. CAU 1509]
MKSKPSLDDLQLFHQVVQLGSLSAASATIGVPIATLSRRLQALERTLGCRLLERSAHHFALTEAGQQYFAACGPLLEDLVAVTANLDDARTSLGGSLRITAPVNLTQQWMGPCYFDFMRRYPGVRLQLQVSNHYEDMIEQQLDAAIRVGEPQDSRQWIARPIGQTRLALCAAPAYLQQSSPLVHPRDLVAHSLVVASPMSRWNLTHRTSGEQCMIQPQPYFQSNDIQVALDAAHTGFGIVLVPDYYFLAPSPTRRELVPVLPDWYGQPRPIYLMYRDRNVMSARLRAFVDHVVEWMARYGPPVV